MGMDGLAPFVFLLSPSIRSLVFEPYDSTAMWIRGARESYKSLLHIISEDRSEDLSAYRMLDREGYPDAVSQYLRIHGRLTRLEELDLDRFPCCVDGQTLAALSQLSALHTLRVRVSWPNCPYRRGTPTLASFANLRHLELDHAPLQALSRLLATGSL